MSYEEEDAYMSYEEEDTCSGACRTCLLLLLLLHHHHHHLLLTRQRYANVTTSKPSTPS